MNMKKALVIAAPLVAVCVMTWIVAAVEKQESAPVRFKSVIVEPVEPIVVSPANNVDLEACSPADNRERSPVEVDAHVEVPAPEITWYDPHSLAEVGSIS